MNILLNIFLINFSCVVTNVYGIWNLFGTESKVTLSTNVEIKGKIYTLSSGKQYAAFMGIPYARAPVKELRFEVCNYM